MSIDVKLRFGAMSPRISEQLEAQGLQYKTDDIIHFQHDADAIVRLRVRGLLPASHVDKCFQKLHNKITSHVASVMADNTTNP